jgi:hypothetical protein
MALSLRERFGAAPRRDADVPVPLSGARWTAGHEAVLGAPDGFVPFTGYALDCEIHAFVPVADVELTRWSDLLNASTEIRLHDAVLIGLDDLVPRRVGELNVLREELVAAWASPFRGAPELRVRTRSECVTFRSGPYRIEGFLHALPTADTIVTFGRRAELVPLTEATIELPGPGPGQRAWRHVIRGDTLIVNRSLSRDLRTWRPDVDLPPVARPVAARTRRWDHSAELLPL